MRWAIVLVLLAGCATPILRTSSPTDQSIAVGTFADGVTRGVELGNYHTRIWSGNPAPSYVDAGQSPFTTYAGTVSPIWGQVDLAVGSWPIPAGGLLCWGDGRIIVGPERWYVTTLGFHGTGERGLCVLVSKSADPRAGWWLSYVHSGPGSDYPGITRTDNNLWVLDPSVSTVWRFPLAAAHAGNLTPGQLHHVSEAVRPAVPRDRGGASAWFLGSTPRPGQSGYTMVRLTEQDQASRWSWTVDDLPDRTGAVNTTPNGLAVSPGGSPTPALAADPTGPCGTLALVMTKGDCDLHATQWRACDGGTPFLAFTKRSTTPLCFGHPAVTFDRAGAQWVTAMGNGPAQWPQMHLTKLTNDGQWFFGLLNGAGLGVRDNPFFQLQTSTGLGFLTPGPDGSPVRLADYLGATTDATTGSVWLGAVSGQAGIWYSQALRVDP